MAIWGGEVTFSDCDIYENTAGTGGGVLVGSADATFTNCNIYENSADYAGGGAYIYGSGTEVTFTNCKIYDNTASSGANIQGANMVVGVGTSVCLFEMEQPDDVFTQSTGSISSSCLSPPSPSPPPSSPPSSPKAAISS